MKEVFLMTKFEGKFLYFVSQEKNFSKEIHEIFFLIIQLKFINSHLKNLEF